MEKENKVVGFLKEFFRPSKGKIIISVVLTVIFIFVAKIINYAFGFYCRCSGGGFENCKDYYSFLIVKWNCHCSCTPLIEVYKQYFWFLLFPFLIIYIIVSTYNKIKKK